MLPIPLVEEVAMVVKMKLCGGVASYLKNKYFYEAGFLAGKVLMIFMCRCKSVSRSFFKV